MAQSLEDAVFVVDEWWRLQWANREGVHLVDAARLARDGAEFLSLFCIETRERIALDGAVVVGGSWSANGELCGDERTAVTIVVHSIDAGAPAGWRWVRVADRSAVRSLEDALRDAQALDGVGRLALALSHEFSELLTAITGSVELIAHELAPRDAILSDLQTIRAAADRAAVLTRELSRTASSRTAAPQRTDLSRAVAAMDATLRRTAGDGVALSFALDPDVGHSILDVSHLEASIIYLARNARDAMPSGGVLHVSTRLVECTIPRRVVHGVMRPGRYACVDVRDTGIGMDEATQSHCFEPLFSTWGREGLGLSLVFGATTQMGGYVMCESAPGRGTTVSLFLPQQFDPALARPETVRSSRTVLVVDDEESVRRVAARTLRREGYRVFEAADADEALALVSNDPSVADLLLTDLAMPGLNGLELASCIVAARPDVRILFSSGASVLVGGETSRLPRGASFLPKPFTPKALGDRVRAMFLG